MAIQESARSIARVMVGLSRRTPVAARLLLALACLFSGSSFAAARADRAVSPETASPTSVVECSARAELEPARVSAVLHRTTRTLLTLHTAAGPIVTTPEHPFARVGSGWIPAAELGAGDRIVTADGDEPATVLQVDTQQVSPTSVYNLTVERGHAYYVGADRLLVHNMDKGQCSNNRPTEKAKDRRKREKAEKEARERAEQEERENLKRETEATVKANEATLKARQREAIAALQELKEAIKALDPNALIGFRGSLANGRKGPQKGNAPWDPEAYDVDAFIVSDVLASRWEAPDRTGHSVSMTGNKMRGGKKVGSGWRDFEERLDPQEQQLRDALERAEEAIKKMPGVKRDEKFQLRVFSQAEYDKMVNRKQDPLFPDQPVFARRFTLDGRPPAAFAVRRSATFIVTV